MLSPPFARTTKPLLALVALMHFASCTIAAADDVTTVWISPGENVDVYWSMNLSGKVFVAADNGGHPACLDYWWIVWPFTNLQKLGRYCGRASFDLPGLSSYGVGGKLRAGSADVRTRIRGTSSESIASRFPEISF